MHIFPPHRTRELKTAIVLDTERCTWLNVESFPDLNPILEVGSRISINVIHSESTTT